MQQMWAQRAKFPLVLEAFRKSQKPSFPLWFCSFYSDTPQKKPKPAPLQERRMIDRFRVHAKGGHGGNGCFSVCRSRHDRRGRPDGGNGGRGGGVILECSPDVWDFSGLHHHINAKRGGHGASKNKIGTRGEDKIVQVPVGTVIHLIEGDYPSVVQKHCSSDLDPWDMPGTVDVGMRMAEQQHTSRNTGNGEGAESVESSCASHSDAVGTSTMKQTTAAAFPQNSFSKTSRHCEKISQHHKEEFRCEQDSFDLDEKMTDTEQEEELEEEKIQYNVAELTEQGQRVIVARGGNGGLGSVCVSKVPVNSRIMKTKNHDFEALEDDESSFRAGQPGSEAVLLLELKSIADVGLVGMPNAGKSTLLGAISRARPTIGNYAFTTLRPNLGNLKYDDFSITVADIPGLIKGAHENRGLGHAFLRHIERTKVLAFVVDLSSGLNGKKGIPPWEQLKDLVLELEYYREGLSDRPSLVVANKIDEPGTEEVYEELKRRVEGALVYPVCAVLEEGVPDLKAGLRRLVNGEESSRLSLYSIVTE